MRDGRWRPYGRYGARCCLRQFHEHEHTDAVRTWRRRRPLDRPRARSLKPRDLSWLRAAWAAAR